MRMLMAAQTDVGGLYCNVCSCENGVVNTGIQQAERITDFMPKADLESGGKRKIC